MKLWHYTCADHGLVGIEAAGGVLQPNAHPLLPELGAVVWATEDETLADPAAVGFAPGALPWTLAKRLLHCDRTAVRYEVPTAKATWWPFVRGRCEPAVVADLESYGKPHEWWVVFGPVAVARPVGRTAAGQAAVDRIARMDGGAAGLG